MAMHSLPALPHACTPTLCRAYGNVVGGFLLDMMDHPAWLLTVAYIMCVINLLVGEQVVEYVLFAVSRRGNVPLRFEKGAGRGK